MVVCQSCYKGNRGRAPYPAVSGPYKWRCHPKMSLSEMMGAPAFFKIWVCMLRIAHGGDWQKESGGTRVPPPTGEDRATHACQNCTRQKRKCLILRS